MCNKYKVIIVRSMFVIGVFLLGYTPINAQVTRIYTDFNGMWTSGVGDINPIKPDNTHHVLGFTYDGVTYSTGVNDALLTQYGVSFTANKYQALPVVNVPFPTTTNAYAQFGEMQDGIHAGTIPGTVKFPFPYSAANMPTLSDLLTDGTYGLDISTGVTNIPDGNVLTFEFTTIENEGEIGDGVPDFLITQIADPSTNKLDEIWFEDGNGNQVGDKVTIEQNSVSALANTVNDLFTASGTASDQINKGKQIRLVALEADEFNLGLGTNYQDAKVLKYKFGGTSDPAFVAFNYRLLNIVVANDDNAVTNVDTPVDIPVLANDFIPSSAVLQSVEVIAGEKPQNGTATVKPNNTITYTPDSGFIGIDFFKYNICSTTGSCDEAKVMVVVGESDIAVTKVLDNPAPAVGDPVTFTVTVTNNGPHDAVGTRVTDLLPSGYTYTSHTVTPANSYSSATGTWMIGDLEVGDSESLTLSATIKAVGSYTNTATASSLMHDPDLTNNQARATPATMPSASVTADCAPGGAVQEVTVELTGTPNWSVEYTYNGIPHTEDGITSTPFVFRPDKKGAFYVTKVTDGNGFVVTYPTAPLPIDLSVQALVYSCFSFTNPMIQQQTK